MNTRKTTADKITGVEEQIRQLENQRKRLRQQERAEERKKRNHRICKRGGLLEKLLPATIPLTDEQFQAFLEKVMLNDQTRRTLDRYTPQEEKAADPAPAGKSRATVESHSTDERESEVTDF
jgi:hypothetical protein